VVALAVLVQSALWAVRVVVVHQHLMVLLARQTKAMLVVMVLLAQTTQTAVAVAVLVLLAPMLLQTHKAASVEMAWLRASQALQ
jgi:hypothetical protein